MRLYPHIRAFVRPHSEKQRLLFLKHAATRCNTLQHIATHCKTLQHSATHCNTPQHTAIHYNTLQRAATNYNTLQHTAILCNTLQYTATHYQHIATHLPSNPITERNPIHRVFPAKILGIWENTAGRNQTRRVTYMDTHTHTQAHTHTCVCVTGRCFICNSKSNSKRNFVH